MSNRVAGVLLGAAAAMVLSAATASAQEGSEGPGHRQGFWATLGGGLAVARNACSECGEDTPYRNRPGFYLQLGGVASRQLLVAGEVFTQSDDVNDSSTRVTNWTATAQWYPWSPPVYFKFGFGLSRGKSTFVLDGVENNEARTGVGIMFGFGGDLRVSRALSVSPVAAWYLQAVGDFETAQGRVSSVSANTWFVGVGLTLN
jgi:hypothetical protein